MIMKIDDLIRQFDESFSSLMAVSRKLQAGQLSSDQAEIRSAAIGKEIKLIAKELQSPQMEQEIDGHEKNLNRVLAMCDYFIEKDLALLKNRKPGRPPNNKKKREQL